MNQYLWINDCFYENTVNQRKTLKFFLKKNLFLQIVKEGVQIFGLSSDIPDFDWLPVVTWGLYQNTKALSFPSVNWELYFVTCHHWVSQSTYLRMIGFIPILDICHKHSQAQIEIVAKNHLVMFNLESSDKFFFPLKK